MSTRLAVLASGGGTLLDAIASRGLRVHLMLADRPCRAFEEVAKRHHIKRRLVHRTFGPHFDRNAYTVRITDILCQEGITHIAMAGWMTIFTVHIFENYPKRILNSHPSLLPSFKGDHAVRDALAYGVKVTGTTIHIATPELDAGPILAQEPVRVLDDDDEASLHNRIKEVEWELYPKVLYKWLGLMPPFAQSVAAQ